MSFYALEQKKKIILPIVTCKDLNNFPPSPQETPEAHCYILVTY